MFIYHLMPATYFMSGVRPIETIVQFAICEQAPMAILYNYFCMAELLFIFLLTIKFSCGNMDSALLWCGRLFTALNHKERGE